MIETAVTHVIAVVFATACLLLLLVESVSALVAWSLAGVIVGSTAAALPSRRS